MDIHNVSEESYKRGFEAGQHIAWNEGPFHPDLGGWYCVRKKVGKDTAGNIVLSEPVVYHQKGYRITDLSVAQWFKIPAME